MIKLIKICLIISITLTITMGCKSSSDDDNAVNPGITLNAWVSDDGAEISFTGLQKSYEFYRSRDQDCNILNYTECTMGVMDLISNTANTIQDKTLTLKNPAYYILKDPGSEEQMNQLVSTQKFSARSYHQVVLWNEALYLIGGVDANLSLKNDVWKSTDGQNWIEVTSDAAFSARAGHQVVVWNNVLYLIGGNNIFFKNDVWKSTDGKNWIEVTPSAAFSARYRHQVVIWNNVLYLIGGQTSLNPNTYQNDVWKSDDGVTWTEVTSAADFSARAGHQVVVYNDTLYLVGGYDGSSHKNDVWKSNDGQNWTEVTSAAAFSARADHQVVVWNNALYLVGGYDGSYQSDIWKSIDGKNWEVVLSSIYNHGFSNHQIIARDTLIYIIAGKNSHGTPDNYVLTSTKGYNWEEILFLSSPPPVENDFQIVVLNNILYLISANYYKNEIWKSDDAINWKEITRNPAFSGRYGYKVVVWNNALYLIGGGRGDTLKNDVWKSTDGKNWIEVTPSASFPARDRHQVVVFKNSLYLIGGRINSAEISYINDIWKSDNGKNWQEVTSDIGIDTSNFPQIVVKNDVLYLFNGNNDNNIWKSDDGKNWTVIGPNSLGSQNIVWNNTFYRINGAPNNDIWKSDDGITWETVTDGPAFKPSYCPITVWNNAIYLIGGTNNTNTNKIWKSTDGINWKMGISIKLK